MPALRVYADTSVFGGVEDEEFAEFSQRFFARVRRGDFVLLISTQTLAELLAAPDRVKQVLRDLPTDVVESVAVDREVEALANAYLEAGVLPPSSRGDAVHVAAASVAAADVVVSWNFRHIVRLDRIRKFNGVNALKGYRALEIRSPMEVCYGPEAEEV